MTLNTERSSLMEVHEEIMQLLADHNSETYRVVKPIVEYYEQIISCMPGNVYWLNKDGRTIGCNRNVLTMLGVEKYSDFYGLTFEEQAKLGRWTQSQGISFKRDTEQVVKTGQEKANVEEPPIPGTDGKDIYFITTRFPLFNKNYEVIGVVGISTDITQHRQTQEALKKAEGKVDGMALVGASIAHELRSPLAGIKSALFGLGNWLPKMIQAYQLAIENHLLEPEMNLQDMAEFNEVVNNIDKKVDQCNSVIDMLLTNLGQNQINFDDFEPCSIQQCIQQALEKYTFTAGQASFIQVDISHDFSFHGKEMLVIHILFNLLKNSLYFIQKAKKGRIQIRTEIGEDEYNRLFFKDTGQGIPEEILPKIFDQFFTKDTHHGTGIGLAFIKMAMLTLKGDITCHSQFGEYTEFVLRFPKITRLL